MSSPSPPQPPTALTPSEPTAPILQQAPSSTAASLPAAPASSSRPGMSRSSSFAGNIKGFVGDYWDEGERPDWMGAFTLLDVLETFFDSRLDLIERRLKVHSDRLKSRAGEVISKSSANLRALAPKSPRLWPTGIEPPLSPQASLVDDFSLSSTSISASQSNNSKDRSRAIAERELRRFKAKVLTRVESLSTSWDSARTLRTRDKVAFLFGVMTVLSSALVFGLAPEWIPILYTVQSGFYLPTRIWTYKRKSWHYFLWDMCYYVNLLDLVWMWFFPSNTIFFTACYLLSLGPLASAIVTWRNSLVFHSLDKVTSLFIHFYPPFALTVILHFYPGAETRFPGINRMGDLGWWRSILLGVGFYVVWQGLYWRFVIVGRREKIEKGMRTTSFQHLLHDKHNVIGKWMRATAPEKRESLFMFWQLVYTVVCFLPAIFVLQYSSFWSGAFLIFVFAVATWNGANYYVEVWGRKFERELDALRKEMAAMSSSPGSLTSSPSAAVNNSTPLPPMTSSSVVDAGLSPPPLSLSDKAEEAKGLGLEKERDIEELELDSVATADGAGRGKGVDDDDEKETLRRRGTRVIPVGEAGLEIGQ